MENNCVIQLSQVLGAYRDGELEAVVVKNDNKYPIFYKVEAMSFDAVKDFLGEVNVETKKV